MILKTPLFHFERSSQAAACGIMLLLDLVQVSASCRQPSCPTQPPPSSHPSRFPGLTIPAFHRQHLFPSGFLLLLC